MNIYSKYFSGLLRALVILAPLSFAVGYIPVANASGGCGAGFHKAVGGKGECVKNHTAARAAVINKNCSNRNGNRSCR